MPETSRECVVVLLDDTSFSVPVKPTLLGSDLLDMAASHMKVKEKDYFSLYTEGEGFKNWLEMDKPVLDPSQDLPKGSQPIKVYFAFKYFIHNLRYFSDFMTVELLYLQSRQAISKGEILTDEETVFELAACVMQVQHGDFKSDEEAKQQLRHLPVLPVNIFNSKSVNFCEGRVMYYYRMMNGLSRGEAVFKYLDIIQSLPMYSMHFFEVKDKKDVPLWLGVGPDGICECLKNDKNEQTNRFQWLQLQNIYYKDKKFSMEVYRSNARSGRKGAILGPVSVHAWYGISSKVIIAIWKMARDQHMFYRSKRTTRDPQAGMNLTEIIRQLNKHHRANISPSSSHSSLSMDSAKSNNPQQASAEAVAAAKAAQSEMYQALLSRRSALVIEFEKKAARYKEILIKEMQITGIPPDGLTPEEIERMRKKFGVSFKFSKFVLDKGLQGEEDEVETLEKEVEINQSILRANKTLLDQTSNRKLKKDRKKDIKTMEEKLQKLEGKVEELKKNKRSSTSSTGSKFQMDSPTSSILTIPGSVPVSRRRSGTPGGASIDDNFLASMIFDTPTKPTSHGTMSPPSNLQKSPLHKSTSALNEMPTASPTPPSGAFTLPNKQHGQSHLMGPGPADYQGHPQSGLEHSYSDNYVQRSHGNDPSMRFLTGGDLYADEYDLSPPGSLISGHGSVFSPPTPNTSRRSNHGLGLRESNLTDDFLQHFSDARGYSQHKQQQQQHHYPADNHHAPMSGVRSDASFNSRIPVPRRSNASDSVTIPSNMPSVAGYKRASSPVLGFPVEGKAGYVQTRGRQREYSPDTHPPYHAPHGGQYHHSHQQYPPQRYGHGQELQYRSPQTLPHSYQSPSPISTGNYGQQYPQGSLSMGKPSPQSSAAPSMSRKAPPTNQLSPQKPHSPHYGSHTSQTRSNALWYDDNSIEATSGNATHRMSGGGPMTTGGGHMTGGSGQRKNQPPPGQVPPTLQTQSVARQQSEESYDLQEMLKIWDSSNKSPFGEGTLV